MLNVACMQKIKIGHPAKFRDKDKCFLQLLFPVRAILRCLSTSGVLRARLLIEILTKLRWRVHLCYSVDGLRARARLKTLSSLLKCPAMYCLHWGWNQLVCLVHQSIPAVPIPLGVGCWCISFGGGNLTSANKIMMSADKFTFSLLQWKCHKTIGSCINCAFIEIWSTCEVWRAFKKLKLLLHIFYALQTSHMLHISMSTQCFQ